MRKQALLALAMVALVSARLLPVRAVGAAARTASLRRFHDAFVAAGGLPIPQVRKILLK